MLYPPMTTAGIPALGGCFALTNAKHATHRDTNLVGLAVQFCPPSSMKSTGGQKDPRSSSLG